MKGEATQIAHQADIDEADQQPLAPWILTLNYRYVRITPVSISGRRFRREPEPERY